MLDFTPVTAPAPASSPSRPAQSSSKSLSPSRSAPSPSKTPVIAASGTFAYGIEFAHLVDLNKLGGLVVKGLSAQPMLGNPSPRVWPRPPPAMVNAIGLQNIGVRAFVAEKLPQLRPYNTAIIANVFGHCTADYVEVIRTLEDAEGLAACELNISCPNVERGGIEYSTDPALTASVVGAARAASRRPLWGQALAQR